MRILWVAGVVAVAGLILIGLGLLLADDGSSTSVRSVVVGIGIAMITGAAISGPFGYVQFIIETDREEAEERVEESRRKADEERDRRLRYAFTPDFNNATLSGQNLSTLSLAGKRFVEAILVDTNFHGSDLRRADFRKADLSGADFTEADLSDADLSDAILTGATFSDATLHRTVFDGATLTKAEFRRASRVAADRSSSIGMHDLREAYLRGQRGPLYKASFESAVLIETRFGELYLVDIDFEEAKLIGTNFTGCRFVNPVFVRSELENTRFNGSTIGDDVDLKVSFAEAKFGTFHFGDPGRPFEGLPEELQDRVKDKRPPGT